MISEFLITVFAGVALWVIDFLPELTNIPAGLVTAMTSISGPMSSIQSFLPTDQILLAVVYVIGIEVTLFTFTVIEWLLSKIWPTGQMSLFK